MRAATTTLPPNPTHNRVDQHYLLRVLPLWLGADWTGHVWAAYGANIREYTHPILEVRDVGLKVLREGFDFEQSLEQLGRHGWNIPNQFLHASVCEYHGGNMGTLWPHCRAGACEQHGKH